MRITDSEWIKPIQLSDRYGVGGQGSRSGASRPIESALATTMRVPLPGFTVFAARTCHGSIVPPAVGSVGIHHDPT